MKHISPIDGRYQEETKELVSFFSESSLFKYRLMIEIEYLIALSQEEKITELKPFTSVEELKLKSIYINFSEKHAEIIKKIENQTHHDVKAVEYFLQIILKSVGRQKYIPFIHFALTSEDVNNLAYILMWRDALQNCYLSQIQDLVNNLQNKSQEYKDIPLLALTHGQPASPTTLGKEFAVYAERLKRQIKQLKSHKLQGKLNGATGTWSAHQVAYPDIDWIEFSKKFIESFNLEPQLLSTQINSYDSLAENYHIIIRINNILTDFSRDIWLYISRGIFIQEKKAGEIGSSTMPHKINPILFENAEGNLGLANSIFNHLANTLPISRLQRDLSGSTLTRNQGVPLAHSLLACKSIIKGLNRIIPNEQIIKQELGNHWEVLAEAIQTILRKHGHTDAYEQLKKLTHGEKITKENLQKIILSLKITESEKQKLLKLTPASYIGIASKLINLL
ncbi:MAG: adenylosuccinate lyase [Candidatus Magasanikbacteria bacterium]